MQLRKRQRPRGAEASSNSSTERKRRLLLQIVRQYQATNQPLQTKPKKRVKLRVERNTGRKGHLSRRVLTSKWKIISKEDSQSIDQNRLQPRLMNRSLRKLLRATDRGARVVEDSKWSIRRRENHRKPRGNNRRQVKVKESLETIKGGK